MARFRNVSAALLCGGRSMRLGFPKEMLTVDGLPLGTVVTDLEVDDHPYVLTAGTYGRGAWQADLELFDPLPLFGDGFETGDTLEWSGATP